MRNDKIDWTRGEMEVSQLCDQRNDEMERQAKLARRRIKEEKRQKAKVRASNPKAIKNRNIQNVATH